MRSEIVPGVVPVVEVVGVVAVHGQMVEEADLQTLLDPGLAGQGGADLTFAGTPDQHPARATDALAHAADSVDERLSRVDNGFQDRTQGAGFDQCSIDGDLNRGCWHKTPERPANGKGSRAP